jgi:hypothetical protein
MAWFKNLLGAPKIFAGKITDDGTGAVIQANGNISEGGVLLGNKYAAKATITSQTVSWADTQNSSATNQVTSSIDLGTVAGNKFLVFGSVDAMTGCTTGNRFVYLNLETASNSGFTANLIQTPLGRVDLSPNGNGTNIVASPVVVTTSSTVRYVRLNLYDGVVAVKTLPYPGLTVTQVAI